MRLSLWGLQAVHPQWSFSGTRDHIFQLFILFKKTYSCVLMLSVNKSFPAVKNTRSCKLFVKYVCSLLCGPLSCGCYPRLKGFCRLKPLPLQISLLFTAIFLDTPLQTRCLFRGLLCGRLLICTVAWPLCCQKEALSILHFVLLFLQDILVAFPH